MDYSELITKSYEEKYNTVGDNLKKEQHLFPNKKYLTKSLDASSTLILQTLFQVRVGFLEEFTVMFSLLFYKQKFEKVILELEKLDMLQSKQTPLGKAFILTPTALHYIYTAESGTDQEKTMHFSPDSSPSDKRLLTYKTINGILASQVLSDCLAIIESHYYQEAKEFRTYYTKRQYLTNYVYKAKSDTPTFSKKELDSFIDDNIATYFDDSSNLASYKKFVKCYKETVSQNGPLSLQLKNAYLRDYTASITQNKDAVVALLRKIITRSVNNFLRGNPFEFWRNLYTLSNNSPRVRLDFNRFYNKELLRNLSIIRHSLLSCSPEKEADKAAGVLDKIENLDKIISSREEMKSAYDSQFEVMCFKGFSETDIPQFEPQTVNLDTLKNIGVYISDVRTVENQKPLISFAVRLDRPDDVTASSLFKKLEHIFLYYVNNLMAFDFDITLYTYYTKDHDSLLEKHRRVIQLFKDTGAYSLLISKLTEAKIITTEIHPAERFQLLQSFARSNHFFE